MGLSCFRAGCRARGFRSHELRPFRLGDDHFRRKYGLMALSPAHLVGGTLDIFHRCCKLSQAASAVAAKHMTCIDYEAGSEDMERAGCLEA